MSRRTRVSNVINLADLGTKIRRDRKELVVVDRDDPTIPNRRVRGAKLYDPLDRMELSRPQAVAAAYYRDQVALSDGIRGGGDGVGGLAPWQRSHYPGLVLDAVKAVRELRQAVGLEMSAVFIAVVEHHQRLRQIEAQLGMRNGTAKSIVIKALDRVADHQVRRSRA